MTGDVDGRSLEKQEGYSIAMQLEAMRRYAEGNGFQVLAEYAGEETGSGSQGGRGEGRGL